MIPEILGVERFRGRVVHTCVYKSNSDFRNQRVLVIGCGNFGMEVSLELCKLGSRTFSPRPALHMVFRNTVFRNTVFRNVLLWDIMDFFNKFISIWICTEIKEFDFSYLGMNQNQV